MALITESEGDPIIGFGGITGDVDAATVVGVIGLTGADFLTVP